LHSESTRVIWFFGLPSSGKAELARSVAAELRRLGRNVCVVDGEQLRASANADLRFSERDRSENVRRSAQMVRLMAEEGVTVLATFVTPTEDHRRMVRRILSQCGLCMVHVACPLAVCLQRDTRGLYDQAQRVAAEGFAPDYAIFEQPSSADLTLRTDLLTITEARDFMLQALAREPAAQPASPLAPEVPEPPKLQKVLRASPLPGKRIDLGAALDQLSAELAKSPAPPRQPSPKAQPVSPPATLAPPSPVLSVPATPVAAPISAAANPSLATFEILPSTEPKAPQPRVFVAPEVEVPKPAAEPPVPLIQSLYSVPVAKAITEELGLVPIHGQLTADPRPFVARRLEAVSAKADAQIDVAESSTSPLRPQKPKVNLQKTAPAPKRKVGRMLPHDRDFLIFASCCLLFVMVAGVGIFGKRSIRMLRIAFENAPEKKTSAGNLEVPQVAQTEPAAPVSQPPATPPSQKKLALSQIAMMNVGVGAKNTPPADAETPASVPQTREPESPQKLKILGEAVMRSFWSSSSWQEKLSYVHQQERVAPAMQDYYEVQKKTDPPGSDLQVCKLHEVDGLEFLYLGYTSTGPRPFLEIALRRESDGSFKLDWESYVGASSMAWEQFTDSRPSDPTTFRVYADIADYYNYEFTDEKKYLSLRLESPDGKTQLFGFLDKTSETYHKLFGKLLAGQKRLTLTVKLAYPANPLSRDCVKITQLIADRWLVNDSQVANVDLPAETKP
jgi:adenylylsulfate kinase